MSSRNRPRGNIAKEDFADELNLWNSVVDRVRKCHSINETYEETASKIAHAEQSVPDDDPTAALAALEVLSTYHRECLKYSESELKILNEEPDDLIKNLETLISVRTAMEAETPAPRERHHLAPSASTSSAPLTSKAGRNGKRKLESLTDGSRDSPGPVTAPSDPFVAIPPSSVAATTTPVPPPAKKGSRSGSVSAAAPAKAEATSDTDAIRGVASTSTANTTPTSTTSTSVPPASQPAAKFTIGSEVFYRTRSKDKSDEGEGIICTITNILGEGKQRRYEVQDTEPDDNGHIPPPIRASVQSLVAIPTSNAGLPQLQKGRTVFARYPATNTFYKAEVTGRAAGGKKDMCRLRFEGEEDIGTEKEVERRYVLEMK